jgi:hypothetical protein
MKTCKDFEIEPCFYCMEPGEWRNKYCLIEDGRLDVEHDVLVLHFSILEIIDAISEFPNKRYYLKALELYYPELFKEFNKLVILL